MLRKRVVSGSLVCLMVVLGLINTGCSKAPAATQPHPPEVEVTPVLQQDVPIYSEWIGTLDGFVNADIKAQVSGYLLTRNYTEGTYVRKGQLLFEIDPRPFQAALDQAKGQQLQAEGQLKQATAQLAQARAQLGQSEANQQKAQLDEDRYVPLAKAQAVTQQDMDNAVQTNLAAKAQVKSSQAGVETATAAIAAAKAAVEAAKASVAAAQLNLGFTKIVSPVNGIAGIAAAQVGDLVGPSSQSLTTVSNVDPIKVYFTVSEQEYLEYIGLGPGHAAPENIAPKTALELILSDGTTYPKNGKFYVADRNVDQKTGSIRLAGLFPNPGNVLRPGQYGKVRAVTSTQKGALLVPQRAVSELQGTYRVGVVGPDDKVSVRTVKPGERVGSMWIIDEGLKSGESVIVSGLDKVRPDSVVTPKPFNPPPGSITTTEQQ